MRQSRKLILNLFQVCAGTLRLSPHFIYAKIISTKMIIALSVLRGGEGRKV
jgi:hypothetical protein